MQGTRSDSKPSTSAQHSLKSEPQPSTSKEATRKNSTSPIEMDTENYSLQQNLHQANQSLLQLSEMFENIKGNNKLILL